MGRRPPHPHLSLLLLFLFLAVASARDDPTTFYDHLRRYGLPIGIFPKGITTYTLDPSDGSFLLNLPHPCNAHFESQLHYDFNVTGVLRFAQISHLSGVSAQDLFLWFPVKTITVDVPSSGLIYFDVGVVDKQFSLSLFDCPPDCSSDDPQPSSVGDLKTAS